jgi:transposase InsO family protein
LTAHQIPEAFPWEAVPRYLLRDRDRAYGLAFQTRVESMGIEQVLTAPRSPRQNPFVERVIGSVRRECLDHVIVLNERHVRQLIESFVTYYNVDRTHLGVGKDSPSGRPVEQRPLATTNVVSLTRVGGLHHRYAWRQAA